jgi:N-acetylmuramoyl-L-alanine amidase
MLVILDNGHGVDTAGKCSPVWADGSQFREYEFNRDIVGRIAYKCKMHGIPFHVLVPEAKDISLRERVQRANELSRKHLGCWFLSVHANAAVKPNTASGWCIFTSKGRTTSDGYASIFVEEAERELGKEFKIRKEYSDGDADWESNFYVLKNTVCPAMLSENLFMDDEKDCRFLMSEEGRERIAELHFRAIKRIAEKYYGYK